MGKWEFYDGDDELDLNEEQEPSFTLYDFKKWLRAQKKSEPEEKQQPATMREAVDAQQKDNLKELFKQRVKDRVQAKIDKRMAERNKKKK